MKTDYHTIVLGGGPAGTGPLMRAIGRGDADRLLAAGVLWIDRRDTLVEGTIGENHIPSDTAASVLLECLPGAAQRPLARLLDRAETEAVRRHGSGSLPLPVAGHFLGALGREVERWVASSGASGFLGRTEATRVVQSTDGFTVHTDSPTRGPAAFRARRIVFAMGGHQSRSELLAARIAGELTLETARIDAPIFTSSEVFSREGQARFVDRLAGCANPRVVVLGGSHSAITTAWLALNAGHPGLGEGSVKVLCRRLPKLFYASREAACEEGYQDWTDGDVCPVTGRVHRLAGLRLNARDTVRAAWGLGGVAHDRRLSVEVFDPSADEATVRAALATADLVVAAFGYRPRVVPFYRDGVRLALQDSGHRQRPLVDDRCRLLAQGGEPIAGAYGIGLASGFVPGGPLGGEPNFAGQTNGLWLYQNGVGELILDALLESPVGEGAIDEPLSAVV
jgi:hypothetical protein